MRSLWRVPVALLGFVLAACASQPDPLKLYDELVVQTNFDPNANFGTYTTYSIATDSLGFVSNIEGDGDFIVGSGFARPVLTAVRNNLDQRGFRQVDRNSNPDVAINVFVVKNLDFFQQINYYNPYGYGNYPGYFGNPGYYYPGYYGYDPYYYGYPYVSTYVSNNQVLVIEMVDLKDVSPSGEVKVVWNTYMGDLFTALDRNSQTLKGIDQAFVQSPYLSKQ
jgi:hypothetical protein